MAHHSEYGQGMYVNKCNNCSQGLCLSHYQSRCGQLNAFPPKGEPAALRFAGRWGWTVHQVFQQQVY